MITKQELSRLLEQTVRDYIVAADPRSPAELGLAMENLVRASLDVIQQNVGRQDMLLSLGQVSIDYGLIPAARWPVTLH